MYPTCRSVASPLRLASSDRNVTPPLVVFFQPESQYSPGSVIRMLP